MARDARPDLVLIMTDQQRHDQIGYASGGCLQTPNLDRLAASGVVFDNAYSGSTTCVPARTSLMTGLFHHRVPQIDRFTIEPGTWTLPHALKAVGYQTALIGKMHFDPIRADHGFEHMRTCEHLGAYRVSQPSELAQLDHYHDYLRSLGLPDWRFELPGGVKEGSGPTYPYDVSTHPTNWVGDEVLSFLEQRDRERPMLLVVSFPHPHPAVNPPEPYASMYQPEDCPIDPDGASVNAYLPNAFRVQLEQADHPNRRIHPEKLQSHQAELARTYGLITQIDDAVGRIAARLDLDRTLLYFTSDHGDYAGHRGLVRKIPWIPFDDLAKVACFATGGPVAGTGRTISEPTQSFDLTVTFMEAAGLDENLDLDVFDGQSQLRLLGDPDGVADPDRAVFSAMCTNWPMVRRGPNKYIRDVGWKAEVLFEVVLDPDERYDLKSQDPDRKLIQELNSELERVRAATIPDLPRFGAEHRAV